MVIESAPIIIGVPEGAGGFGFVVGTGLEACVVTLGVGAGFVAVGVDVMVGAVADGVGVAELVGPKDGVLVVEAVDCGVAVGSGCSSVPQKATTMAATSATTTRTAGMIQRRRFRFTLFSFPLEGTSHKRIQVAFCVYYSIE